MNHNQWEILSNVENNYATIEQLNRQQDKEQLYEMLDLNAEQLTYYLEEAILDNPFIELEYPIETKVATISSQKLDKNMQPGLGLDLPGTAQSLPMFLFEQIMMHRNTPIREAMIVLVDYLDERGYLPFDYKELAEKLSLDEIIVLDAVTLIKQLEPAGVGAYDLRECLMLQTEQDSHSPAIAYLLLEEHFELIEQQKIDQLVEVSKFSEEEVLNCLNYFHSLRPIPSDIFNSEATQPIPDVSIRRKNDSFEYCYNRQYYPRIVFNHHYFNDMAVEGDEQVQLYIQKQKEKYLQLSNNLMLREQLIRLIVQQLVTVQEQALLSNIELFQPYLIKDLAKDINLSEALVKLVITNKYLEWNHQVYPMTKFINVTNHAGRGGLSTVNIKSIIKEIVEHSPAVTNAEILAQLAKQKIIMNEQLIGEYRQSI